MKDHIKVLELHLMYAEGTTHADTFRAAIELMNAAKPKDEAAERERCERAFGELEHGYGHVDVLVLQRAQARAEGYAQGAARYQAAQITLSNQLSAAQAEVAQLRTELQTTKPTWYVQNKLAETEAKLSAAQVEIAKLTSDLQRRYEDVKLLRNQLQIQAAQHAHWNDVSTQLSAAQAEIADLKATLQDFEADTACEDRCDELETKLTNLRVAAEDFIDSDCDTKDISVFAAAIEASR